MVQTTITITDKIVGITFITLVEQEEQAETVVRDKDTLVRQDQELQDQVVALLQMREQGEQAVLAVLAARLVRQGLRDLLVRQEQTLPLMAVPVVLEVRRARQEERFSLSVSQHILLLVRIVEQ